MRLRMVLTFVVIISFGCLVTPDMKAANQSQSASQNDSLARAKELSELAIQAKGGREKLYQVTSLADSNESGSNVEVAVFPDRYFSWADTRPSKIGLIVEMLNFERNFGFTIWGDNPPDVRRKNSLDPAFRSRFLTSHLYYFLETRWFKPELLKAYKGNFNGKQADILEVLITGYGRPNHYRIFLDEKTHLPLRIGLLPDAGGDMLSWVDLSGYQEIGGVKVPTLFSPFSRTWNRILVEINPDYNPEFFEHQPDMKAGAFQWRRDGKKQIPALASKETPRRLSEEQIAGYIKDLESKESERVLVAGRELVQAGEQAVPQLIEASKSTNADLRFFAAASLLAINQESEAGIQTMKSLLLDSTLMADFRQTAAFRLMNSDKGILELRGLLKHTDVMVRRCVIFAFDELTELTEIPEAVKPAIPVLKELKKDKDEVVRGMAEEILEQIEARLKKP